MATDPSTNQPDTPEAGGDAPSVISPAMRKRLQRCFERGKEVLRQENPDRDYAHTMFAECVVHDPGNLEYVETMLENLQRKYNNNKRGARLKGFGGRGSFKKAVAGEDWSDVFRQGLDLLKTNPWDVPTLRALAKACQANHLNEVELRYLKNALDVNSKDVEVNRHCAESLARMGQFDQAIACWHRIEELDKGNLEARTKISELTLAKTRGLPGTEATTRGDGSAAQPAAEASKTRNSESRGTSDATPSELPVAPQSDSDEPVSLETLEANVADDEADVEAYLKLAQAYTQEGRYRDAYQILKRGLEASGGNNLQIREELEESQIRMVRAQVAIAEQRAAAEKTDEAADLVKRFRAELNRQELQVFSNRVDRFPKDLKIQFELGVRLKRDGNFHEARKAFDAARADSGLRAHATLEMGECFQYLKQYGNAIKCYQAASEHADDGGPVQLLALYRTGVLASGLKNLETAEKALQELVDRSPDYRDAQARLDKLIEIRDKG